MLFSAANSHLKILDRVVVVVVGHQLVCPSKPAPLMKSKQLAGECHRSSGLLMLCYSVYLAHRRSVAVLCMLFKMQPLSGALPLPCVPARITRDDLVVHIGTRLYCASSL